MVSKRKSVRASSSGQLKGVMGMGVRSYRVKGKYSEIRIMTAVRVLTSIGASIPE